jgi:hypothetical protein
VTDTQTEDASTSRAKAYWAYAATVLMFIAVVGLVHHLVSTHSPPLFGSDYIALVPALLAVAAFALTVGLRSDRLGSNRLFIAVAIVSVICIPAYVTTYHFVTVKSPVPGSTNVYQVGFATAPWSLRPTASEYVRQNPSKNNAFDIMIDGGGFRPGGPETLWKPWTIWAAGLLLAWLFTMSYVGVSMTIGLLFHHPKWKPGWMEVLKVGSAGVG